MKQRPSLPLVVPLLAAALTLGTVRAVKAASITYVGVIYDRTDFDRLNIGNAGYWFPQFGATSPVVTRPTGENCARRIAIVGGAAKPYHESAGPKLCYANLLAGRPGPIQGRTADVESVQTSQRRSQPFRRDRRSLDYCEFKQHH